MANPTQSLGICGKEAGFWPHHEASAPSHSFNHHYSLVWIARYLLLRPCEGRPVFPFAGYKSVWGSQFWHRTLGGRLVKILILAKLCWYFRSLGKSTFFLSGMAQMRCTKRSLLLFHRHPPSLKASSDVPVCQIEDPTLLFIFSSVLVKNLGISLVWHEYTPREYQMHGKAMLL